MEAEPPSRKPTTTSALMLDDVVEEVLLRLPPTDPASLARAALVCTRWRRIVSDPGFRRRFTAFHHHGHRRRTPPPMLSFLCNIKSSVDGADIARSFPAAPSFPSHPDRRGDFALDARHGRVLLQRTRAAGPSPRQEGFDPDVVEPIDLLVWDPVTRDEHRLPVLFWHARSRLAWNAAVLCAAAAITGTECDHHDGPFSVVFVGIDDAESKISAFTYSSETGAWAVPVSAYMEGLSATLLGPSVLAGEALHFTIEGGQRILAYHLAARTIDVLLTPNLPVQTVSLIATEDGRLGIAGVMMGGSGTRLGVWSRHLRVHPVYGAMWCWEQHRAIELGRVLLVDPSYEPPFFVVGFAEGAGIVFVGTGGGVFTVELSSGRVTKVLEIGECYGIVPYVSFYTPRVLV
ncbi:hypothetical protein QOZ80_7BG0584700 [Eleusine coracana subsp. coracana]|nr:hypothetical protein QOZ80_7BG0584700 [Eleusine coracana subsp. coracana]